MASESYLAVGEGVVEVTANRVAIVTDMAIRPITSTKPRSKKRASVPRRRLQDKISDEEVATINASLARSLAQLNVKRRHHGSAMIIPARAWLATYDRTWLRGDVMAGITLAAYLLPSAIGDASLAGLPPQAGLYACLFGGLVFWLFCSSRHTAIAVTSAISLLIGALAGGDLGTATRASRRARLAHGAARRGAGLRGLRVPRRRHRQLLLGDGARRLQVRGGCFPGEHAAAQAVRIQRRPWRDFWERMGHFFGGLGQTNPISLALGVVGMPAAARQDRAEEPARGLFVVIGGIVARGCFTSTSAAWRCSARVPQGLPMPALPLVSRADINRSCRWPWRASSSRRWRPRAIGACSEPSTAIAGCDAGVSGDRQRQSPGWTRQRVSDQWRDVAVIGERKRGRENPALGLVAAVITLLIALFFTGLLRNLPQPVLAAIILVASPASYKSTRYGISGASAAPNSLCRWRRCSVCLARDSSTACCWEW
jgi:hypothetical protein